MKRQVSRFPMQVPAHDERSSSAGKEETPSGQEGQQLSMLTHAVQFYEDDSFLIDSVSAFVLEGLHADEQVTVFMTPAHTQLMKQALRNEEMAGTLPRDASRNVLYHDAEETMAKFMVDGWPEEHLFMSVIGQLLQPLPEDRRVRVFGEMVCLLWQKHQYRAALRLEELWNTLIGRQAFSLLCAYCITGFRSKDARESYRQVCGLHGHVHPHGHAA